MFDFNNNLNYSEDYEKDFEDKFCPKCNLSLTEILRSGTVGCANCYKFFENEIKDILIKKQGSINHVGKVSSKHISKIKVKEKLKELEEQKELAVRQENFIVAESLKNQIEKLKGELANERL